MLNLIFYNILRLIIRTFELLKKPIPGTRADKLFQMFLNGFINSYPKCKNVFTDLKYLMFYSQFIKKGDLCFDIGANIGKLTRLFILRGGRVISVEPQKKCINYLRKNFGNNKNVVILEKAVGDYEGLAKIFLCDSSDTSTFSTLSENFKSKMYDNIEKITFSKTQQIEITTLDHLIELYGCPKFCKIDVEGYELQVLKGLSRKIPYIHFEMHMPLFDEMKKCIDEILSLGKARFNFTVGDRPLLHLSSWVSKNKLYDNLRSFGSSLFIYTNRANIYVKYL